jgi:hypothetical protein
LSFDDRDWVSIGVDYHPDGILTRAAESAGIDVDGILPWKTTMWIEKDVVTVSKGYRAQKEVL